ncbi:MAG: polysaccharide deacetylase family protein [Deltaproteobacteria bacterium]|nr:polysaccharide deacetylase family protein [Deltaproteobacteria bacterium]
MKPLNKKLSPGNIKRGLSSFLYKSGIIRYLLKIQSFYQKKNKNPFRILFYHRINDYKDPFSIDSVSTRDFDDQMKYVSQSYNVLSLEEIYHCIKKDKKLPDQCIAITFDDGYEDNYTNAYQILKKYDLPATIFLTVDCIDTQTPLWFDRILHAFKTTQEKKIIPPWDEKIIEIETTDQKLHAAHLVLEQLKKTDNDQRIKLISVILNDLGNTSNMKINKNAMILNWSQVREMGHHKISFGSHTMTHPILTNISGSQLQWELATSRKIIEEQTGHPVYFIAYPNGQSSDYDEQVIRLVRQNGYKAAMTTAAISNNKFTDFYTWARYKPWQNQVEHFATSLFIHGLSGQVQQS